MVFPQTPRERGEIQVGMSFCGEAWNVDAEIFAINGVDGGSLDTVSGDSEHHCQSVEPPDGDTDDDPALVTPLVFETVVNVQVAPGDSENHQDHMPREERFIKLLAKWCNGGWTQNTYGERCDYTPVPVL